jgi:hypothetical protein
MRGPTKESTQEPSENALWAQQTLSEVGYLWGSDLGQKLIPSLENRAAILHPASHPRWWWHAGSTGLVVFGFWLGVWPYEDLSGPFAFLWVASVSLHAYVAFKAWVVTSSARDETKKELFDELDKALAEARSELLQHGPFGPSQSRPPDRELNGVDARDAEHLCATWLAHLGEENVKVTRATGDGGVDIVSARCLAQVKNYQGSVGVVPVRELVGVASVDGRFPVFFTSGTYTKAALEFADQANVYLFKYDAQAGTLDAKSAIAEKAFSSS